MKKFVKKSEGKQYEINKEVLPKQTTLEVGLATTDTKVDDKQSFENYKEIYKDAITEKCISLYGRTDDKTLWEDTAKEMYLTSENYIPTEDIKAEGELDDKLTESKKLNESDTITIPGLTSYKNIAEEFKNYPAFIANFEPIVIVKINRQYYVYRLDARDSQDYSYQTNSKDNMEGWLYGMVQANNKRFKALEGLKSLKEGYNYNETLEQLNTILDYLDPHNAMYSDYNDLVSKFIDELYNYAENKVDEVLNQNFPDVENSDLKFENKKLEEDTYTRGIFQEIEQALEEAGLNPTRFIDGGVLTNNIGWTVYSNKYGSQQISCNGSWYNEDDDEDDEDDEDDDSYTESKDYIKESSVYRNTEDSSSYIVLSDKNQLEQVSAGDIVDFGKVCGFNKVGNTTYIVTKDNDKLYLYSVDTEFPFIFNLASKSSQLNEDRKLTDEEQKLRDEMIDIMVDGGKTREQAEKDIDELIAFYMDNLVTTINGKTKEELKLKKEDHQLYYDDIQDMSTKERHKLWMTEHDEDFPDNESGNDMFWDWAEEEFPMKEIEEEAKLENKKIKTESDTNLPNITWILEDFEVEASTKAELGRDYLYHTLVTNEREAERFNYHSDYWGDANTYQEEMTDFVGVVEPYIGKDVIINYDDGDKEYKVLGVLIDEQYNSLSHAKILVEEI